MLDKAALLKVIDTELERQRPKMETWEECKAKMPLVGCVVFPATITFLSNNKCHWAKTHGFAADDSYSDQTVSVSDCPAGLRVGDKILVEAHAFGDQMWCKFYTKRKIEK